MKDKKVSFILQAKNEEKFIANVVKEIQKVEPMEIIVVVNGSTDSTADIVKSMGCKLIHYEDTLGINMGKAIGALYAKGDILVFHDSDIVVSAEQFISFIDAIRSGYDIALNDLKWTVYRKNNYPTAICKRALNIFLQREDLLVNSFGAIPNAISKEAANKIGWWNLVDPPLTQAIAVNERLTFKIVDSVNVINNNPVRRDQHKAKAEGYPFPKSTTRIIGDHIRAISYILQVNGKRGGYDDGRQWDVLNKLNMEPRNYNIKRSAVISAEGERKRPLSKAITELKKIVQEVIVVGYQLTEYEVVIAKQLGAKVINFQYSLGMYASRVIGASRCTGNVILFTDSNLNSSASKYSKFLIEVENNLDIALNNVGYLLDIIQPHDSLSIIKLFFNIILKQPELLNNSLSSVPFAIRRNVIEKVGIENLAIPPLFLLKAKLKNLKVGAPCTIEIRSIYDICSEHINSFDRYKAIDRFIGDYLEAIEFLLTETNERGDFPDGNKNRDLLETLKMKLII